MPKLKSIEAQFELRKPATPYICSTPGDFHLERDWLTNYVFPRLEEVCQARGTYLSPVDVRWSSEDSVAQNGHLLHLLLDLVKQSSPYFLCLLGERYGPYRPKDSPPITSKHSAHRGNSQEPSLTGNWLDLNFSKAAECGHSWVLKDGHENCSIPELEIIAATVRGSSEQCAFYFRQSEHLEIRLADVPEEERAAFAAPFLAESEHAGLKMQTLKQTIVKKGLPVRYFKSPQELGQIVYEDWIKILDTVHPTLADNGCFLDTARYTQWAARQALLDRLQENYVSSPASESILQQMTDFALSAYDEPPQPMDDIRDTASVHSQSASSVFRQKPEVITADYQSILLLSGDRGAGKSMLLAQWLKEFVEETPDLYLIHCYIGTMPGDSDIAAFLRHCIRDLRRHFLLTEVASYTDFDGKDGMWWSEEDSSTPDDFLSLVQAFVAAASLGPCVLLLDGINDLSATHGMSQHEVKEFGWLPFPLPPHCRVILSTTNADLSYRSLQRRADVTLVTAPSVVDCSLKISLLEKNLKPHVASHVRSRRRQLCEMRMVVSPLALCVLGSELNTYSIFTDLEPYMDLHSETGSLRVYWTSVLQQWVLDHSWTRDDEGSVASKDDGQFDYTGWVADALCLLAVSRGGLRQEELLQILDDIGYSGALQVTVLHWWQFRMRAGALLWENADGCIRFSHQHLQDVTEYLLLRSINSCSSDNTLTSMMAPHQSSKRKVHMHLANFFAQQPLSRRQIQELPWHLMMAGEWDRLLAYLTHNRVAYNMLTQRERYPDSHYDLRLYWRALAQQSQISGMHYLRLLKELGLYTISNAFLTQGDNVCSSSDEIARQQALSTLQSKEIHNGEMTSIMLVTTPRITSAYSMNADQADGGSGIFLTSLEQHLNIPDILEGAHADEKKEIVSTMGWAVSQFLLDGHQTTAGTVVLSSLLTYLQASFPLAVDTLMLLVRVLERLGTQCLADGDTENAVALYHQALRVTFDLDALEDETCDHRQVDTFKGVLLGRHGSLQMVDGELFEAGELLKEATESICHLTGNHALRATLLYQAGLLRSRLAEYQRAEASLRQALALRVQWHGQTHPEVAEVLLALARLLNTPAYSKQQDPHEIESLYRRALSVSERCFGSQSVQVSQILLELGQVVAGEGSQQAMTEARDLLQRSLDIRTTALGADDPSTRAARQSVRRVEVALQLGLADGLHSTRRSNLPSGRTKHSARHAYSMRSRAGTGSRTELGTQLDIRSVSRESVLRHNRPDSMLSSAYSLMSASERLLASRPQSSLPSKVKAGSRITSAASSSMGGGGVGRASMSVGWSAKSQFLTEAHVDIDEKRETNDYGENTREGEKGERRGGEIASNGPTSPVRQLVVDLDHAQQSGRSEGGPRTDYLSPHGDNDSKAGEITDDTPRIDSFAVHLEDGTILIGDATVPKKSSVGGGRKRVTVRPSSAPRHLFKRYANIGAASGTASSNSVVSSVKPRPVSQRSLCRSRIWSGRSGVTSVGSTGSHLSRCRVPGPHEIHPSNARTLQGPHSDISSLLGPPPCPRENVVTQTHHRSAFYHVPGRYPTGLQRYPPRRSQRTEGARVIESVMSIKMAQVHQNGREALDLPPSGAARAPTLGVNQQDVNFIVRQTGLNRPNSRGGAILTSARAVTPVSASGGNGAGEGEPSGGVPAVKFREPIAVN